MKRPAKSSNKRRANRLYRSAKISEYQFKRVLWSFVLDEPVAQAAQHIDLSANSINAIYSKLRRYFFDAGLFTDIYQGGDPRDGSTLADEEFERRLIDFHIQRLAAKRGVSLSPESQFHHFAESHWRFHYTMMTEGRSSDAVHQMMFAHLLEGVRSCGPVGVPPDRKQGLLLTLKHMDQRIIWLERNAVTLRNPDERAALRSIRLDEP